jgi:hypothetical protein
VTGRKEEDPGSALAYKKIVLMKAKSGDCENNNYMLSVRAGENRRIIVFYLLLCGVLRQSVTE